tara:strand:+ start:6575 stop:7447 length:873 start_codon:yes stop_codon:yes gene_type:complete
MKIHLASFYSPDLKRSADRFLKQAIEMKIYNDFHLFTVKDLNQDFKNYVDDLIKKGKKKGYGYWVWQTFVHQNILSKIDQGDIYHWCDVGCHLNKNGRKRLLDYINILDNDDKGFLGFDYKKPTNSKFENYKYPEYLEYEYTKEDLFKHFNVQNNRDITDTPQVWGGSFFVKKCHYSLKLLEEHFDITRNRFDLIDDDPKKFIEKTRLGFKAHRHSQSVLSIIVKKADCKLLSAYESEWALDENNNRTYAHLFNCPIIAKRDKKKNIFKRFIDRQKKNYLRFRSKFNFWN